VLDGETEEGSSPWLPTAEARSSCAEVVGNLRVELADADRVNVDGTTRFDSTSMAQSIQPDTRRFRYALDDQPAQVTQIMALVPEGNDRRHDMLIPT